MKPLISNNAWTVENRMRKHAPKQFQRIAMNRGGNGISTPVHHNGVWYVTRDIQLGKNIPGYAACKA